MLSLREAIAKAQNGDTIQFSEPGAIKLSGKQLGITKSITIDATTAWDHENSAPGITVDGNLKSTVFSISGNNADVRLKGLKIANGKQGIYVYQCSVTIENCTISDNKNDSDGGGIYAYNSTVTITNSLITRNSSNKRRGGGIAAEKCTVSIMNSEISGNSAYAWGGITSVNGAVTITNSTISGNSATSHCGGVSASGSLNENGSLELYNSIVALNYGGDYEGSSNDVIKNCLIGTDPKFVSPPIFVGEKISNLNNLDLRLTSGSLALDRGNNDYCNWDVDLDNNERFVSARSTEARVDIGAYEYQEMIPSVSEEFSGEVTTIEDVVDPTDGKISLREAILYADDSETIKFAPSLNGANIKLNDNELFITRKLTIDASSLSERITIDGDKKNRVFSIYCDVSLNNVIITNGNTNGSTNYGLDSRGGGGVFASSCTLTMINSVISENNAN
ncbi:MAG: hypothetical protein J6X44_03655, partial [Thermoguttaceae bacterium]|nr:hypothetical protein [Thermoguttaceae bacterium]